MKILFLLLPLALAACGPAKPDKPAPAKPRPLESQHQALDQARALEQQLQQQADAQHATIRQQTDAASQ